MFLNKLIDKFLRSNNVNAKTVHKEFSISHELHAISSAKRVGGSLQAL